MASNKEATATKEITEKEDKNHFESITVKVNEEEVVLKNKNEYIFCRYI